MSGTGWSLIVPFFVNDLETNHFVVVVKQAFFIKVPNPNLFAVIAIPAVSYFAFGD